MASHSYDTYRANSENGGMTTKVTKHDDRGCLSTAILPRDVHIITLSYQCYISRRDRRLGFLLGERWCHLGQTDFI